MKFCLLFILYFFVISESADLRWKRSIVRTKLPPADGHDEDDEGRKSIVRVRPGVDPSSIEDEDGKKSIVRVDFDRDDEKDVRPVAPENTGTFWHISDLHLDSHYDLNAPSKSLICPSSNGAATINAGPYGDYRCDSPYKLINASIHAMKKIFPNPDFIIWTGDDTFHTNDENEYFSEEIVLSVIKKITDLITEVFPSVDVYPALGNHDYFPKNQMPVGRNDLLSGVSDLWSYWLDVPENAIFKDGGYYTTVNKKSPNIQMVVLNTNLWYSSNKVINVTYDEDPGGQFAFLESVLLRASGENLKVYIIGHIPPGYFELVDYKYWMYPQYNDKYVQLIQKYSHVIAGQFFGHHHTDTFRIFDLNGQSVSTAFIAPGVSPWMTTLPGVEDGANNPAIRLYYYNNDESDMEDYAQLKDYLQYYLDLDKANSDPEAEWELEYKATEAYGLGDLSNSHMEDLYKDLKEANLDCRNCQTGDDCENCQAYDILQAFSEHNSVLFNRGKVCDEFCQRKHVCAIAQLEQGPYEKCINSGSSRSYVNQLWVFVVLAVLFITNKNC